MDAAKTTIRSIYGYHSVTQDFSDCETPTGGTSLLTASLT